MKNTRAEGPSSVRSRAATIMRHEVGQQCILRAANKSPRMMQHVLSHDVLPFFSGSRRKKKTDQGRIYGIFSRIKHKMLYVLENNEIFFRLFLTNELVWLS
jgi:hypothetical protein